MTGKIDNPRGYLFLDVDGVLNPLRRQLKLDSQDGWHLETVAASDGNYRVWVGDPLSDWLNGIIDQGIQIVWATTWINDVPALTELAAAWRLPLDLPRISGLNWYGENDPNCGKQAGVAEYIEANNIDPRRTRCAWVDDMLGVDDMAWAYDNGVYAFPLPGGNGLSDIDWVFMLGQALKVEQKVVTA